MEDKIYELVTKDDEVTWQSIMYELIKTEQLDPWNVNISKLSKRYQETIKELQELNFFVSGKMILAAAILLRLKSDKLVSEYIADFDNQLFPPEEELLEEMEEDYKHILKNHEIPTLTVKTPQTRKKQITLKDLMSALEKALEVDERRRIRRLFEEPIIEEAVMPKKSINITDLIKQVYEKIVNLWGRKEEIMFTDLLESEKKEDKVATFVPLLHLANQQKVDLEQEKPFANIKVTVTE